MGSDWVKDHLSLNIVNPLRPSVSTLRQMTDGIRMLCKLQISLAMVRFPLVCGAGRLISVTEKATFSSSTLLYQPPHFHYLS